MLARLARWLRAAGHDTELAGARTPDGELVQRALREDRWLLSLDRGIGERKAASGHLLLLPAGEVAAQARWLATELGVDWLARPFSRCLVDNTELQPADVRHLEGLPTLVLESTRDFRVCPACGRVYWPGSHHRRMHATLAAWRAGLPA